MKCINCQTENKDTAKFCRGCGAALTAIGAVQLPEATIKSCPGCQNACKLDTKFCPKCGHSFAAAVAVPEAVPAPISIEQPQQVEIKIEEKAAEGTKLCPGCGNSLKLTAKFCGKCGFDFEPAQSVQRVELNPPQDQSVRSIEAILPVVTPAAAPTKEVKSIPPELKKDAPAIKEPSVQPKPEPMQPAPPKKIAHPEMTGQEQAAKSYVVPTIAILLVSLIGGGAYWWFKVKNATEQVTQAGSSHPYGVVEPASAVPVAAVPISAVPVAAVKEEMEAPSQTPQAVSADNRSSGTTVKQSNVVSGVKKERKQSSEKNDAIEEPKRSNAPVAYEKPIPSVPSVSPPPDQDIKLDSQSESMLAMAEQMYASKSYSAVLDLAKQVLRKHPSNPRATRLINNSHAEIERQQNELVNKLREFSK